MEINKVICDSFVDGYNRGKEDMLVNACEWIVSELYHSKDRYGHPNVESRSYVSVEDFINDFKKAMLWNFG